MAICMASDAGYAFPTAVVAKSIAQRQYPHIGPIYFVWVDAEEPPHELVTYLEKNSITFVTARNSMLPKMASGYAGHLTPAASARLFLAEILEKFPVDRFLYLDGDVEIVHSLSSLAKINLPQDYIAAAEEYGPLLKMNDSRSVTKWQKRLQGLGMPEGASYFNSGVILAHMQSWAKISNDAQAFLVENTPACIYFDQCALNAVCYNRRLILSPKWNFQAPLFRLNVETDIKPNIVHFTGAHKPWASVQLARPWQARGPFLAARTELPQLWKRTALRSSLQTSLKHQRNVLKQYIEKPNDKRRRSFLEYMASTNFIDKM